MRQERGRMARTTEGNVGGKPQCAIVRLVFGLGSWTELVGSLFWWSFGVMSLLVVKSLGTALVVRVERSVSVKPSCVDGRDEQMKKVSTSFRLMSESLSGSSSPSYLKPALLHELPFSMNP
jgi:hypothetical protein